MCSIRHRITSVSATISVAVLIAAGCGGEPRVEASRSAEPQNTTVGDTAGETTLMKITSTAFQENGSIPAKYTCRGEDAIPPLEFGGVPGESKTLALVVDDPDAPGGTFVHWILWNVPPETKKIDEGTVPSGVEGINSSGRAGWMGPCPPSGTHRYFFRLYALDTTLTLEPSARRTDLDKAMSGHTLAEASLMGTFSKR